LSPSISTEPILARPRRLLAAEQPYVEASAEETRAIRDRFVDTAALFQALGGGWWNAEPEAARR